MELEKKWPGSRPPFWVGEIEIPKLRKNIK